MRSRAVLTAHAVLALVLFTALAGAQTVTPPQAFFGFQLGADRKIARWDRIVEYFKVLEKDAAGKLKVVDMGPTTMGNPFLLAVISSPANIARLEHLRQLNLKISDPRGFSEVEIRKVAADAKAVICQSMSLHASEIGGTQMAPELAFELVSRADQETRTILDNVIFLMIPSFNPDGAIMVADWYQKTLGTEYEGAGLPWLYHKYAGHDNNRDAFQTNLVESRYMARILFTDWVPQAYVDHHHMGSYGARIYVPPYAEPVRPYADPLVWREHSWYGAHIAYKEEEAGLSGVLNMAQYSGWGHFGFHWITPFHNIAGMLTESASAKLASPIYIHPDQLRGETRGLPEYEQQTTFPSPWPGGWWRLRDVIERQKVSAWAVLDLAARNRETVLWNAYLKARRQTERGAQGKPAAYVIPSFQHDPLTVVKLINKLLLQGIEIRRAGAPFTTASGMTYAAGSYIVPLAQPKMGLIRYLLGRTFYPDNSYTRDREGSPVRPYDMATDTMFEFMGVRVDPLDEYPSGDPQRVAAPVQVSGKVASGSAPHTLDGRLNDSFRAVNLLWDKAATVRRNDRARDDLHPGDFIVSGAQETVLREVALATGVEFRPLAASPVEQSHQIKRLRVGMYQRYGGGNADEGWTRLLLEQFSFPYTTILDTEIKQGGLNEKFDVILLPDDSTAAITGDRTSERRRPPETIPPEYRSGIGNEGIDALKAFVGKGGSLVALGGASLFAIEKLGVPVTNALSGKPSKEFFCPGSTLRVSFDTRNPLAYGMPERGLVLFFYSPVFEIVPGDFNERCETPVTYADRSVLESGWLIGEQNLTRKAAMVSVRQGEGKVILIGFRTQHRAQTHGTFKLLFNALVEK
jgi:hypothetical protein